MFENIGYIPIEDLKLETAKARYKMVIDMQGALPHQEDSGCITANGRKVHTVRLSQERKEIVKKIGTLTPHERAFRQVMMELHDYEEWVKGGGLYGTH